MKILKPALLALVCATLLAFTNEETRTVIAHNQQQFAEREVRKMVAGATLKKTGDIYQIIKDDKKTGTITPVSTQQGYNGLIDLMVARDSTNTVINVRVITHKETPGIGDKIDLQVSNWILGFNGQTDRATVDAITGATITSRAVTTAVNEVLAQ